MEISHSLLDGQHIVVSSSKRYKLELHKFSPTADVVRSPAESNPPLSLCLPLPAGWKKVRITDIHSSAPPQTSRSPHVPTRPFQTDPAQSLLAVEFNVRDIATLPSFSYRCTLLIPHATIHALAADVPPLAPGALGRTLEWAQWGPRGSALVRCADALNAGIALRPFGSMYPLVVRDPGTPPPWPAVLLDLNPWARVGVCGGEAPRGAPADEGLLARVRSMLYDDPRDAEGYLEHFAAPVRTQLPYAVYRGPRLFAVGARTTTRVDVVDGGFVAVVSGISTTAEPALTLIALYQYDQDDRTIGFDTYTV